ncbi:MAG: type II toxin-antitoxin system RelE/ParE family toxin [Nanoarchaeota archaeon]|nr:type II toxin-antitoxin system RelE/ParE family toxin [Nanoarchaeota archaeon]
MVKVAFHPNFKKLFSRIKDKKAKEKIIKQLIKIKQNPNVGKPLKFTRNNTRATYIAPFRLSYIFIKKENKIIILDLYHKDEQ